MVGLKTNNMKQYITPLLRAATLIVLLYTIYEQYNIINTQKSNINNLTFKLVKSDSLQSIKLDSLQSELFIQRVTIGRYELGLDFLKERRPNEYNLLMHYINTQTE